MTAPLTGAQLRAAQIKLERAIEAEDYATAEEMALILAPFVDARCNALDADPASSVPDWGVER